MFSNDKRWILKMNIFGVLCFFILKKTKNATQACKKICAMYNENIIKEYVLWEMFYEISF